MENEKKPLIGMNLEELQGVAQQGGMPRFVGKQLAEWIYGKRAVSFDQMVNISKKNRQWLEEHYDIGRRAPSKSSASSDGTVKYLFQAGAGKAIESVYIPDRDRATLCVSSQVGCKMNCYFCATGRMGFHANLPASAIINQILSIPPAGASAMTPLTNVVFMGMGEPLDNFKAVERTIEILTAPWGLAWSPKRITVSTVGKLPELKDLLEKTQVHVALSLHTPDPAERESLMPAQKPFPLSQVLKILEAYDFTGQRRLSMEYIMWRGVNDDMEHARQLVRLIGHLPCRVNLIRYHYLPGSDLKPCSEERMLMFRNYLNQHGITATIRASRGEDIDAACGMLASGERRQNQKTRTRHD